MGFGSDLRHAEKDAKHARERAARKQHDLDKEIERKEKAQEKHDRQIKHAQDKLDRERSKLDA
jgi:hypothetical protein